MPKCLHCDRTFSNREALHQHLRSSGVEHPFCEPCDRRFISQEARNEHMAARHPPTFPCTKCDRVFGAQFALDDHFRGSPAHPNCAKCGRGFDDIKARNEHYRQEHPKIACLLCNGALIYKDLLEHHYKTSTIHPKCSKCGQGFENDAKLRQHILDPNAHQECVSCKLIFKDHEEYRRHMELGDSCQTLVKTAWPIGARPNGLISTTASPRCSSPVIGRISPSSASTFEPNTSSGSTANFSPILYSTSSHVEPTHVVAEGLGHHTHSESFVDRLRVEDWRRGPAELCNANEVSSPRDPAVEYGVGRFRDYLKQHCTGGRLALPSPETTSLWSAMRNIQLSESLSTRSISTAATVKSVNSPANYLNIVPSRPATARGAVSQALAPQASGAGTFPTWRGASASAGAGRRKLNISENGKYGRELKGMM